MKIALYQSYIPGCSDWLPRLPESWEQIRGRFVMTVNPPGRQVAKLQDADEVSFVPMEAVGEHGGLELDRNRRLDEIGGGYTAFEEDDVVVAKITPCFENGKGAIARGLSNGVGFGTTELHVLRAGKRLNSDFLFYLTISHTFRMLGESEMYGAGGQKRVPPEFAKDFRIPLPPIEEQVLIAAYLDAKTAQIDTLISQKRQLIDKLKEKRNALIARSVTRGLPPDAARAAGLNPSPKMSDSGVDWLGEIPAHWAAKAVRHLFKNCDSRRIPLSGEERAGLERLFPYYGASGVIDWVDGYLFDEPTILVAEDGANLLSRSSPLAFLATGKYWVNNHAHILKPLAGDIRYWVAVLESFDFSPLISGSAQPKLTGDRLAGVRLPVPPITEQVAIADYLQKVSESLDALVEQTGEAIARLTEYRQTLITAAVTGKIDVRGLA
jgi:type I restriction enzyme, S subunit